MSYIAEKQYTIFDKSINPYNIFSLNHTQRIAHIPITNHDGNELKSYWQPESLDNNKLLSKSDIKSNSDYRRYMTSNATLIRDHNIRNYAKF